jgi:uncharacterized protein (PEP-CTERM system associated)
MVAMVTVMVQSTRDPRALVSKKKLFYVVFAACLMQSSTLTYAQVSLPGTEDSDDPSKNPLKRPGITVLPGVRTSVTYSDNLALNRKGEATAGFRVEVAPYILAAINSAAAQGYVYYGMRNFFLTAGPEANQLSSPRHDFKTTGKYQLLEGLLALQGSAFVFDVNPINFGVTSADSGNVFLYPQRIQGFNIGPVIESQLGNFATYGAGYSYGQSGVRGVNSNLTNQILNGNIKSGSAFNRWGWEWNGLNQVRDFSNGGTFQRNLSNGIVYWTPSETWRLGASIRYSQIDGFTSSSGKNKGFGPGIAINWNPSSRTQLKLTASSEYFGTTGEFSFTHSTARLIFDALYERGGLNSTNATLLNQNPTALTRTGDGTSVAGAQFQNYVSESLYSRYGVLTGFGIVDSAFVVRDGGRASVSYKLSPLSKVTASYFNYHESTKISTSNPALGGSSVTGTALPSSGTFVGDVYRQGISLTSEISLDARSKLGFSLNSYTNRFISVGRDVRIRSASGVYSTRVSPSTTALFGIRHSEQSGVGYQTITFGENSVFGALDMRF